MRIFISVGDPSGDQHAAGLVGALKSARTDLDIEGLGGPRMRAAGARIDLAFTDAPIIGVSAVLPRLLHYRRLLRDTVARLVARRIDVLVLVDYPGFNLRLAERAKRAGIKTVYYIGPQIWAWAAGRIKRIKRAIDLMLVVFEFEHALYLKAGVPVRYVGHPLLDQLDFRPDPGFRGRHGLSPDQSVVGLFPGSRPTEIDRIFPVMLRAGRILRASAKPPQLACGMAPGQPEDRFRRWSEETGVPVTLLSGVTHGLMQASDLALVASGTATLETALLGTPQLVLYRTDPLTAWVARTLVRVPHLGLVNLVARRQIAPEFLQADCRPGPVAEAAGRLLQKHDLKGDFADVARELRGKLGQPGAAGRAASAILEMAQL